MLKEDLVSELETTLRANSSTLGSDPAFKEFYARGGSPTKKERTVSTTVTSDGEVKPARQRRKTVKKEDLDSPYDSPYELSCYAGLDSDLNSSTDDWSDSDGTSPSKGLIQRTPRAVQRVAERIPLPPSPAAVTEMIDRNTSFITNRLNAAFEKSGISEGAEGVREILSSVVGVEAAVLMFEAFGLQRHTLPWTLTFPLPENKWLGTKPYSLHLPNFFQLLGSSFWSASFLWASTSLIFPLMISYFFNLTVQSKAHAAAASRSVVRKSTQVFDPLTFNVAKGLLAWLVYAQGFRFWGLYDVETIIAVNGSVLGGYQGMLIGAGIGALVSLYDAILKK